MTKSHKSAPAIHSLPMRTALALVIFLAACAPSPAATPATTEVTASTPASTTTVVPAPTTTEGTSTTTVDRRALFDHLVDSAEYWNDQTVEIHAPEELGAWPLVVTIHGGGWFAGSLDTMSSLADDLADRGAVVFNATYRTITKGGSFPATVDDVACVIAYARHRAAEFTTAGGSVTVVGHSAGAHLASLVTLAPSAFGADCPWTESRSTDALVGLAGPYNIDRLALILGPFFGTDPAVDPEPWRLGNPLSYVEDSPGVPILLVHGDADQVAPYQFSLELEDALVAAGKPVTLELLGAADHNIVKDPRVVGEMIFDFLARQ